MNDIIPSWASALPGIRVAGPLEVDFGSARAECARARHETVAVPLIQYGYLNVSGADAETFLQGQLSNDVREVTPERAQLSSFNSPKGRMLAVLRVIRAPASLHLELHRGVLEAVLRRLRMFVLRAKVDLSDSTAAFGSIGVAGPGASALLEQCGLPAPGDLYGAAQADGVSVVRVGAAAPRFVIQAPASAVARCWTALTAAARPAGTQAWKLLDIDAGMPTVYPETSDRFVPQMCNLDTLGGLNFNKGCYTGQEVVARVHYRGAVKRRMRTLRLEGEPPPPGIRLAEGEVVDSSLHPESGSVALVVAPDT